MGGEDVDSPRHDRTWYVPGIGESLTEMLQWPQRQDLSEADLPYIRPILEESFRHWQEQAEGFPWPPDCPMVLLHPDGDAIAVAGARAGEVPDRWDEPSLGPSAFDEAVSSRRQARVRAEHHRHVSLKTSDSLAVPVFTRSTGFPFAYLVSLVPAGTDTSGPLKLLQAAALHFRSCFYRNYEMLLVADLWRAYENAAQDGRRHGLLLAMLRRLHDHIEVDRVLSEVMDSLGEFFPDCRIDLYLSQDYSTTNQRVKPLAFRQSDADTGKRAFLTGKMQEEREDHRHLVALPLAGKQGVYGVLCLELPHGHFGEADVRFMADLANAAGIAFEKARLHEQANALIGELRVINEITQRLNSSLQLEETLRFTMTELLRLFGAEYCSVLQKDPQTDQFVVITANVDGLVGESLSPDSGFCGVLWQSRESVILSDYRTATPVRSRLMDMTGSRSLLASPLLLNGEMIGAVFLTHREPRHFSYENYKLLNVLSAHLALALSNARLHEEVRRLSITDNLTGLYNRRYLDEIVQRRQRKDPGGSLVLIDVDHFKQINDTFGHQTGDAVLVQVSRIITGSIRESDIAARWGGEELAIYFPKLDLHLAAGVAERIRTRVAAETRPAVTISCGVASWKSGEGKVSVESLFARADAALYLAKKNGRNRVAVG